MIKNCQFNTRKKVGHSQKRLHLLSRCFCLFYSLSAVIFLTWAPLVFSSCPTPLKNISVAIASDNAPWTKEPHSSENNQIYGYAEEHIYLAMKELCYNVTFQHMVHHRIYASLMRNLVDGATLVSTLPANRPPEGISCTPFYLTISWGLFSIGGLEERRKPEKLGALRAINFDPTEHFKSLDVTIFTSSKLLFRSLRAGRIDTALSTEETANYWARELGIDINPIKLMGNAGIRLCLSKEQLGGKADLIANQFTQTLMRIVAEYPENFTEESLDLFEKYSTPSIEGF